jgi:hypothetical protein
MATTGASTLFTCFAFLPLLLLAQVDSSQSKLVLPRTQWYEFDASHPERNVISDGEGGAIVIGKARGLPFLIIQRINRYGQVLWSEPGQARQVALGLQGYEEGFQPILLSDGQGGAFVAYAIGTEFIPPLYHNLYLQHFSANFDRLWGDRGLSVVPDSATPFNGKSEWPRNIVPDGEGGVLLFYDGPSTSVYGATYVQRVNAQGQPVWENNGIRLTEEYTFNYAIPDGQGGAYLFGVGTGGQHVSKDGELLWPKPAVPVGFVFSNARIFLDIVNPQTITLIGNTVFSIRIVGIAAQRFSAATGERLWGESGRSCMPPDSSGLSAVITGNGKGGAYIFWKNVMQEMDSLGQFLHLMPRVVIDHLNMNLGANSAAFVDGLGAFIVYRGCPSRTECSKLYLQRISLAGELPWGITGRVLIDTLYYVSPAMLLPNDSVQQEAFVFFELEGGIYVQRVDLNTGSVITGVADTHTQVPANYSLETSPNPFHEFVHVTYRSEKPLAKIQSAKIYNLMGQVIFDFGTIHPVAERFEFTWQGVDIHGKKVPSGIYFVAVVTSESVVHKKLMLLK